MRAGVPFCVVLGILAHATTLAAQATPHFTYYRRSTPGTLTVPLIFDAANELHLDPWGMGSPPTGFSGRQRLVGALNQVYRFVGTPYMTRATFQVSRFNMDSYVTSSLDCVNFDWFYASSPALFTGSSVSSFSTPPAAGGDSLMFPGTILRIHSGWDSPNGNPTPEHESWGFRTTNAVVEAGPTLGNTLPPTFYGGESIIGVLGPVEDTYRALIAHYANPVTIAIWRPQVIQDGQLSFDAGVEFWAKCGADPNGSVWDTHVLLSGTTAGSFVELGSCPSNWHIAITNTNLSPQAFRMEIASHFSSHERTDMHVGISWNASASEINSIQWSFREAAWRYYSMTAGTRIVRNFQFYNNANHCDDGSVINETACSGTHCDICLQYSGCNGPRSTSHNAGQPDGYIDLCQASGDIPGFGDWYRPVVIAHELGHYLLFLPDEYSYTFGFPGCHHSIMAVTANDNPSALCTNVYHRATTTDVTESVSIQGPQVVYSGGTWTLAQPSMWSLMAEPYNFYLSADGPPMHNYWVFFGNNAMGHP